MTISKRLNKWKVLIVLFWVLFLAAANIVFFQVKKNVYYNQAKTELLNQTEVISRQFHKLIENDYLARDVYKTDSSQR